MASDIDTILWSATSRGEVCICAIGARTPLGFTAAASAAAVRGAISAIGAHPFLIDKTGEPMNLAWDAGLDVKVGIADRMREMLLSAITETLASAVFIKNAGSLRCWIGMPESRPGMPSKIGGVIASALVSALGLRSDAIHVVQAGHAAGLMAIQLAAEKISTGETKLCLVAGVDSYHDPETLEWLDENGLLLSSSNRNGFAPSEAAGACLLAARSTADNYGLPILATVKAASTAKELHTIRSDKVCIGEGLSAVLKSVVSCLDFPQQAVTATCCDLNGERYRNEEFVYTLLRVQEAFVDAHDYQCPADCWGDVGAASGPLFASLAIAACERGYSKGRFPILWAGSESGYRTAVLLTTSTPNG